VTGPETIAVGDTIGVVVLFSGGQDSTTCLAWALERWAPDAIHPVSFDYGQRHEVELACARAISARFGVREPFLIPVEGFTRLGAAALTNPAISVSADARGSGNDFAARQGLPSTFVPGRNLVFVALAAAYGAQHGIFDLVTGVCSADAAGYPDCRPSFVAAAQSAVGEALGEPVTIHTPLLHRTKAQTFALAESLGVLDVIVDETHTCYQGDRTRRHVWGVGCGDCPACRERAAGWAGFVAARSAEPAA
jgi:7-cyano-7-deazaguanine synthase